MAIKIVFYRIGILKNPLFLIFFKFFFIPIVQRKHENRMHPYLHVMSFPFGFFENLDPSSLLFDLLQSSLGGLLYYQLCEHTNVFR